MRISSWCYRSTSHGFPKDLSKYMGVLHVKELQRQLDAEGAPIIVTAVHPGVVNTGNAFSYTRQ